MVVPLVLFACGGSVVFVEDDDGAGGSTSSTSGTTKSATVGSTSTTSSQSTTNGPTTNVSVGVTTTGPVGDLCVLGEFPEQCINCTTAAWEGVCSLVLDNCVNSEDCLAYNECTTACANDVNCCNGCDAMFPKGMKLLEDAVFCAYCQQCSPQCAGTLPGFCP